MSYYDFDDHFWSPQTVCSQSALPKPNKKIGRRSIVVGILTSACVAVWTPLLLQSLVVAKNENQEKSSLDTDNLGESHILSRRERLQMYLSTQQQ